MKKKYSCLQLLGFGQQMCRALILPLLLVLSCHVFSSTADSALIFERCSIPLFNQYVRFALNLANSAEAVEALKNSTADSLEVPVACFGKDSGTTIISEVVNVWVNFGTKVRLPWVSLLDETVETDFECFVYPPEAVLSPKAGVYWAKESFSSGNCEGSRVWLPSNRMVIADSYTAQVLACDIETGTATVEVGVNASSKFVNQQAFVRFTDALNFLAVDPTTELAYKDVMWDPLATPDAQGYLKKIVTHTLSNDTSYFAYQKNWSAHFYNGNQVSNWLIVRLNFMCGVVVPAVPAPPDFETFPPPGEEDDPVEVRLRRRDFERFALSSWPRYSCVENPATPGFSSLSFDFELATGMWDSVFFVKLEAENSHSTETIFAGLPDGFPFSDSFSVPVKSGLDYIIYLEQNGLQSARFPIQC